MNLKVAEKYHSVGANVKKYSAFVMGSVSVADERALPAGAKKIYFNCFVKMSLYPVNFDIMNGFRGVFSLWWVLLVVLYNVKQPVDKTVVKNTVPAVEHESSINPGQGFLSEEFLLLTTGSNGCGYSKVSAPDDYNTFCQLLQRPSFSQTGTQKKYTEDSSHNLSSVSIVLFPFHSFW